MKPYSIALPMIAALSIVVAAILFFDPSKNDPWHHHTDSPGLDEASRAEFKRLADRFIPVPFGGPRPPHALPGESWAPKVKETIIRVIHQDTQEPVAGAIVYHVADDIRDHPQALRDNVQYSFQRFIQEWGVQHHTNQDGVVVLPNYVRGGLYAQAGDLWGLQLRSPIKMGEAVIEIGPLTQIITEVVNSLGVPIEGVPLRLGLKGVDVQLRATDENGRAIFHVDGSLHQFRKREDGPFTVGWGFPTNDETSVEVDVQSPSAEVVRMVLPPTGSVRVRVTGANGKPTALGGIMIHARPSNEEVSGHFLRGASTQPIIDGSSDHPFIGLGLNLELNAMKFANGRPRDMTQREFAGPTVAGERVDVEITQRASLHQVLVRAVDKNGFPLVHQELGITSASGGDTFSSGSVGHSGRTDGVGLVDVTVSTVTERGTKVKVRVYAKLHSGKVASGESEFLVDPSSHGDVIGTIVLNE